MLPKISDQQSKIGFYFHIPFCPHICPYCDFTKTSQFTKQDVSSYFKNIYLSLNLFLEQFFINLTSIQSCTVYFGGGTPSLFDAKFYIPILEYLSKYFILEEVTIETNPFSNKKNFLAEYYAAGIHRVTLGAQSLCDRTLSILGRKHTKKLVLDNIEWLQKTGIKQIQVDLIYGLKHARSVSIHEEIKTLISAGATGISSYGLTLEPRTLFAKEKQSIIDEVKAVDEYESILNTCTELGLEQIETSNFSFYPAMHNQLYWYGYPYFGIGTGAHGLLPPTKKFPYGIRYKVGKPAIERAPGDDLLKFRNEKEVSQNFELVWETPRTRSEMLEELIFTLLRTKNGIPLDWLSSQLNPNLIKSLFLNQPLMDRALQEGKIKMTSTHISLAPKEKIRGDIWALEFIKHLDMSQFHES